MNTYTVRFYDRYPLDAKARFDIHREIVTAENEQAAGDIMADSGKEVIDVEPYPPTEPKGGVHYTLAELVDIALTDPAHIAYGVRTTLPPAKITTLQQLADEQAKSFNRRYYNNPDGLPKFRY